MPDVLLPPAAKPLERALAQACAAAEDLQLPIGDLWSPADCPSALLPWLAWAMGVEDWDGRWDDEQKRAAIAASIPVKRYRGTIGAVRRALAALGFGVEVQEWFAQIPAGDPYTFQLHLLIDQVGYDMADLDRMLQLVERAKNLRSHLSKTTISLKSRSKLTVGAWSTTGTDTAIRYGAPSYSDGSPAFDLMTDYANNGTDTIQVLDRLNTLVKQTIPEIFNG